MIETREEQDVYLLEFSRLEQEAAGGPAWLWNLRKRAIERFRELGFPTTRDEDWKYTNVGPIAKVPFQRSSGELTRSQLGQMPLADLGRRTRLVFVNGRYAGELSSLGGLPEGVRVRSISTALEEGDETLESHLARYARPDDAAFVALNTAFLTGGVLIRVPRGVVAAEPIHVLWISTPAGAPVVSHPRALVLAERESEVTVIEQYVSAADGVSFTNAVTEIVAGEGAVVEYYKLQQESEQAFHVATVQAMQERNSTLHSHNLSFGGSLARNDINSTLDAEGCECILNGLFVAAGRQHVDNHTTLDHAKPHCNSREFYKGILDGRAVGVFNGKIMVRQDAQKTNAIQSNKNLLLSERAVINTKPQLEIYADDVRCTHGATVGQLDKDALFYMQTRGIAQEAARDLLTYAFAGDIFDRMNVEAFRNRFAEVLHRKLSERRRGEDL